MKHSSIIPSDAALLQDLFASGPLMVFEWQASDGWPVKYVSPNIQQILGYSPASLMSGELAFAAIVHPDDLEKLAKEVTQFSAEKRPFWEQHYRLIDAQGKTHWVYDYTRPIYNQQGELETILGYLINQNDADYNHQRFNNLIQNFPGMVYEFTLSPDGKMAFSYVSPGVVDLFELTPAELENNADLLFERFSPADQVTLKQKIKHSALTLTPWSDETQITLPSGKRRWLYKQSQVFQHRDASVVWYGFVTDITEKKQLELALTKSQNNMKLAQQLAKMGSWELDLVANTLYWSDEVFNIFRLDPQCYQPSYETFLNLIHPDDKEAVNHAYQQSVTSKRAYQIDYRLLFADGKIKWVQERAQHQLNEQGEVIKSIGTVQDISEQKQFETQSRITEEIFKQGHDGLMICDTNARIVTVNHAFEELTGYSAKDVLYKNPRFLQSGRHDKAFYKSFWDSLLNKGHWRGEMWNKTKSGTFYPQELSVSAIKDSQGNTINYLGIFHEISEQKQAEEQMMRLAFYDSLTGVANRLLLRERCEQLISRAERATTQFSVMFIDLDHFKDINDTHGHDIGDLLLIEASQRIQQLIRQQDTLARMGGDEFAVLFPLLGADDSLELAKRLVKRLAEPYLIDGLVLSISASMGVTIFPNDAQDYKTLLKHADLAMYQAKNNGRNNVVMYNLGLKL
ncbi:sensor domain-containing protein [Thiomicrospira microaerophila]|uniref:sensor domain-containing protein n=1 Tax=Thiomicrospira microaerophila TaxID=406020 RepID=UPI0005C86C75|nr:PAS domain-containing protein [Thiomicrospira microaerophila]